MNDKNTSGKRTISEEVEVLGGQVVERVQDLVKQGNVRRIIVRTADGRVLLDTTLTIGVMTGGAVAAIFTPSLAILAVAVIAIVGRVRVEIIREITDNDDSIVESAKSRIKIAKDDEEKEAPKPKRKTKVTVEDEDSEK